MKTLIKPTPLALAIAAVFALPVPAALAGGGADETDATVTITKDIGVYGDVGIDGNVQVGSDAEAVIDDTQYTTENEVNNWGTSNTAQTSGNALRGAAGNVGVNVATGDNNVQANETAIAYTDAQHAFDNQTLNKGTSNNAVIGGNVLRGAAGNIGVNMAAGDSNLQKNATAIAYSERAKVAVATIDNVQGTVGNTTTNGRLESSTTKTVTVDLTYDMDGKFAGISDQDGNQYLDTWNGALPHTNGSSTGHIDLDDEIQNANDRPQPDSLATNADMSDGGGLSFNMAGDLALSGTVTGTAPVTTTTWQTTTNVATLNGNALRGAAGNIGVNVASGSNNAQANILSISAAVGGAASGGGPE